jgi:hypothetical protein
MLLPPLFFALNWVDDERIVINAQIMSSILCEVIDIILEKSVGSRKSAQALDSSREPLIKYG